MWAVCTEFSQPVLPVPDNKNITFPFGTGRTFHEKERESEQVRVSFSLLFLQCFKLKITLLPVWHVQGWVFCLSVFISLSLVFAFRVYITDPSSFFRKLKLFLSLDVKLSDREYLYTYNYACIQSVNSGSCDSAQVLSPGEDTVLFRFLRACMLAFQAQYSHFLAM